MKQGQIKRKRKTPPSYQEISFTVNICESRYKTKENNWMTTHQGDGSVDSHKRRLAQTIKGR